MDRLKRAFGRNDYLLPENFKTLRRSDIPVTYRLHDDLLRYYSDEHHSSGVAIGRTCHFSLTPRRSHRNDVNGKIMLEGSKPIGNKPVILDHLLH
uniref:Transposase n=1 Tax=Heterorhabditis bacteriophora TaxID=37862 RepID=A0A1I7XK70_HETBA